MLQDNRHRKNSFNKFKVFNKISSTHAPLLIADFVVEVDKVADLKASS